MVISDQILQFTIVQATGEAFSPQKRTSSTSKDENSVLFSIFLGHFCPPGSGSGSTICMRIRIRIHKLKLMRIHADPKPWLQTFQGSRMEHPRSLCEPPWLTRDDPPRWACTALWWASMALGWAFTAPGFSLWSRSGFLKWCRSGSTALRNRLQIQIRS